MNWDLKQLEALFQQQVNWAVQAEDDCLCITNEDGLDAILAVSGEQIVVETVLFDKAQVTDTNLLNEKILRTHQLFPLSTIAISSFNNQDFYVAFGALSAQSKEESILTEISTLFDNVAEFLDAYDEFIN